MKKLKHLFTMLLLLCTTAVAAQNFKVNDIYYNITDATNKTVEVTYRGTFCWDYSNEYTGSVVIPESVTYNGTTYRVTSIGDHAFFDCSRLTSVVIPSCVISIGEGAFYKCTGLTSVVIPNSVTSIGYQAFYNCTGLTSIIVATGNVNYDSRDNCNAIIETATNTLVVGCKNTSIPNSVTSIGSLAFYRCSGLTSVVIPNSVTSIGYEAFSGCTGLTSVEIPNSVTSIDEWAFCECTGLTSVEIGNSVTSIGNYAFYKCTGLTSIVIPNSVTSIGEGAFDSCTGLTSVEIPNSVTSIGRSAFGSCTGLTSIVIPNCVTSIGNYAFEDCTGLSSIVIPNSVTSIGVGAFNNCTGLMSIIVATGNANYDSRDNCNAIIETATNTLVAGCKNTLIPNSVTSIGDYAFFDCSRLTSVVIPSCVISIGEGAFYGCTGLTSVVIPNSVTSIGVGAFYGCIGLKTVINFSNLIFSKGSSDYGNIAYYVDKVYNLSEGFIENDFVLGKVDDVNTLLTYLGNATEVILPADYKGESYIIGADVFKGNTTITSVVIPNSVTSIGEDAFEDCTGLKTIYNLSNLTFSKGSSDYGYIAYYADNVYNLSEGFIENDFVLGKVNGVNTLVGYLGNATELTLPADYKGENYVIDADVFKGNTTITSVVIPNSVTSIGDYAFRGCFGLTSVEIPNSVTSIGYCAFYNCTGLTSVVIPNSVTSIGNAAFSDCTGLKTIYNFSNLTFSKGASDNGYIAYYADKVYNLPEGFVDNDFVLGKVDGVNTLVGYLGNATELTLPADYKGENYVIGADVFKGNTTITSVVIPNSVTSIGLSGFEGCSNVETLYIGSSIESIGSKAFAGCEKITEIKVALEKPIRGSNDIFADAVYDNATLYVPNGTKSLYEKREPWNIFFYIVEMDFTGIDEIAEQRAEGKNVYYDLSGRAVDNPTKGIYIINGKKVLVK